MKTQRTILAAVALVSICILNPSAFGQGALTPPGAPAPTMKSLNQIEPRTIVNATNTPGDPGDLFIISQPGSYYLTTNVTVSSGNAITISANNVTLDLNGFTIASTRPTAANDMAVLLNGGHTNIAIYNGNISSGVTINVDGVFSGGGFGYGIFYSGNNPANVRVKNVSVSRVLYSGIFLNADNSTVVEGCTVIVAGNYGIYADSVSDSTAVNCGVCGILAGTAHNCKGSGIGNGAGLEATTANDCYGSSSGNTSGLFANAANNCYGYCSGSGFGLTASSANNCYGYASGNGDGMEANIANNCSGTSTGSGTGLDGYVATGCVGSSETGYGLYADVATGCSALTYSGTAMFAITAAFCEGFYDANGGGTAIHAIVANGCYALSGTNLITYKYNMP